MEDLNKLSSSGVNVTVNGSTENYKGALLAFLADTLASHLLGGFKRSMSFAYRNCRTCMATSQMFREKFNSNDFQLRYTLMHLANCQRLTGPLKKHYSKVYGINEKSILLDVNHYSMCDWGLPHDIMHDLFEGVVQYEIKLLLLHCIKEKYFVLSEFNNWLLSFQYGYPVPITTQHLNSSESKHLRQGAAQTGF